VPRLLVFNQYYHPGVEATAKILTELCEGIAEDYDLTVVTGRLREHEDEPAYEVRNGVKIIRVRSTTYDRARLHQRAANYVTYVFRSLRRGLIAERPDIVMCMTDPPLIGNVALIAARRFRAPLVVISQDVFPEIAVELGRLTNPFLIRVLATLTRSYLRRAGRVVAIGETMKERLAAKGADPSRIRVIPNWTDTDEIQPMSKHNHWAEEQGLAEKFVVMHSGNVGHAQDLDTLVRATTLLRDLENLAVVLVGFGARHADHEQLKGRLEADHVTFLPYQPREFLSKSLSTGDVHFVGLGEGLAGYVVPSRLYGILAAGRPVLVSAEETSETARIVLEVGCGLVVPPGQPVLVAHAIRRFASGEFDLQEMGKRGRRYVETEAARTTALQRYRELLQELR
jgi:colanic acid biosynthesis glycosyl transferase WcaI